MVNHSKTGKGWDIEVADIKENNAEPPQKCIF